ncbi:MAG: glycosyltransferase family 87 protein [Flavobacteriales bacterium]
MLTCAIAFSLWHRNIHLGQMTIFLLYLCMEGMHRIDKEEPLKGGFLIAMGISVKIMPLVLVPYLVYRGYFKGALSALVFTGLILFVPAAMIGLEKNTYLLGERWTLVNPMNNEHVMDVDETTFHSITTFLSVLLVKDAGDVYRTDLPRNIADVSMQTLSLVINIVRLILVIGTLYFIRSLPFQRTNDRSQLFYETSYIYLIIPLIFPHQQHYGFFFALPAIAYLVFFYVHEYAVRASEKWRTHRSGIIFLTFLVFFLLNSHFLLGEFRNFYDHYKTLTYGMLLLIVLLAAHRPKAPSSITRSAITKSD